VLPGFLAAISPITWEASSTVEFKFRTFKLHFSTADFITMYVCTSSELESQRPEFKRKFSKNAKSKQSLNLGPMFFKNIFAEKLAKILACFAQLLPVFA
jgi:hypothetical protein